MYALNNTRYLPAMEHEPVIIETERMRLQLLTPEYYNHLFTTYTDAEIMARLGWRSVKDYETEKGKYLKGMTTHHISFRNFLMIDKITGWAIGRIGYHTWMAKHNRAEIGYAMHEDYNKGKGYMTEAMAAVLKYGFEEMNLHRVEAMIGPSNVPSIRLVQRFGFVQEGILRGHYLVGDVYQDSVCWGLLRNEYEGPERK